MKANTEPYPPREVVEMLNAIDAGTWIAPLYEEWLERNTWQDEAFEAWEARWMMHRPRTTAACGSKPKTCDLCKKELSNTFVDGRTIYGVWALMCTKCHDYVGIGLGTGNGQEYKLGEGGDWNKVSG